MRYKILISIGVIAIIYYSVNWFFFGWHDLPKSVEGPIKGRLVAHQSNGSTYLFKGNKYKKLSYRLNSLFVHPAWSPDGSKFVAVGGRGGKNRTHLFFFDKDGDLSERVNVGNYRWQMDWFPSGDKIAYVAAKKVQKKNLKYPSNIYVYIYIYI